MVMSKSLKLIGAGVGVVVLLGLGAGLYISGAAADRAERAMGDLLSQTEADRYVRWEGVSSPLFGGAATFEGLEVLALDQSSVAARIESLTISDVQVEKDQEFSGTIEATGMSLAVLDLAKHANRHHSTRLYAVLLGLGYQTVEGDMRFSVRMEGARQEAEADLMLDLKNIGSLDGSVAFGGVNVVGLGALAGALNQRSDAQVQSFLYQVATKALSQVTLRELNVTVEDKGLRPGLMEAQLEEGFTRMSSAEWLEAGMQEVSQDPARKERFLPVLDFLKNGGSLSMESNIDEPLALVGADGWPVYINFGEVATAANMTIRN